MFYLISPDEQNRICDIESQPFEVAEPLFWIEANETPVDHIAKYIDGQIVFEEIVVHELSHMMQSKPARDAVFCFGELSSNTGLINPNKEGGSYNQCVVLIEGSAEAINTDSNDKIILENVGHLNSITSFKGSPINYKAYSNGAKWVAVNPVNVESLNVTSIAGPNNQIITDNTDGITIFNAKGEVIVNGTSINLNDPTFYHANNQLDIQVSNDSYAILIRY